jgi:hypothetical protein
MNIGMMWFDNDPKTTLSVKIERAAEYYRKKYGHSPNLCMINPRSMPENVGMSGKITIRSQRMVLPGHLWIGLDEKDQ